MTPRFPHLRDWLDSVFTPPPTVPMKRTWQDWAKDQFTHGIVSFFVMMAELFLWFTKRSK